MTLSSLLLAAVTVGDPDADRVVYGAVIALVVIGIVLIGVGAWIFRQTRVDPELLAPLERMSDRTWSRRDPATQRRMLDEVRPDEAVPLHREPMEPAQDEEFNQTDRPVESFDDLKDPAPGLDSDVSTTSDVAEPGDDSIADGGEDEEGGAATVDDVAGAESDDGEAELDEAEVSTGVPAADAPDDE